MKEWEEYSSLVESIGAVSENRMKEGVEKLCLSCVGSFEFSAVIERYCGWNSTLLAQRTNSHNISWHYMRSCK